MIDFLTNNDLNSNFVSQINFCSNYLIINLSKQSIKTPCIPLARKLKFLCCAQLSSQWPRIIIMTCACKMSLKKRNNILRTIVSPITKTTLIIIKD